jgi:hypothetical protein
MADDLVDKFINDKVLPGYRPIVTAFRGLIRKDYPELTEEMRGGTEKYYGVPEYRLNRVVAVISPTKKGVKFAFSKGASFEDKYGLLEGTGNTTRNVRLSKLEDFDQEAMKYYLDQAITLDTK